MRHGDGGFIAHAPPRFVEPPCKIDVFSHAHRVVESSDIAQRNDSAHHCGCGHIAHPRASAHPRRHGSEVEWRMKHLVAGQHSGALNTGDSGRDECNAWVGEVCEQRSQPVWRKLDVGIDKCDEGSGHVLESGGSRCCWPTVGTTSHDGGTRHLADGRPRSIVNDDDSNDVWVRAQRDLRDESVECGGR